MVEIGDGGRRRVIPTDPFLLFVDHPAHQLINELGARRAVDDHGVEPRLVADLPARELGEHHVEERPAVAAEAGVEQPLARALKMALDLFVGQQTEVHQLDLIRRHLGQDVLHPIRRHDSAQHGVACHGARQHQVQTSGKLLCDARDIVLDEDVGARAAEVKETGAAYPEDLLDIAERPRLVRIERALLKGGDLGQLWGGLDRHGLGPLEQPAGEQLALFGSQRRDAFRLVHERRPPGISSTSASSSASRSEST